MLKLSVLSVLPSGDRGQSEQHALSSCVRPLLRPLVQSVGSRPPDPADPPPREGPDTPLTAHRHQVQIPAGHIPTAEQESRLNVSDDAHRLFHVLSRLLRRSICFAE